MNILNIVAIAFKAIMSNKRRSFLTMLGVIIGVGSVVLLTSIGTGLQASVNDQFSALGSNTLFVVPGNPFGSNGGFSNAQDQIVERSKPTLKITQLNEILRNNREVISAGTATGLGAAEAKFGTVTKKITIYGVTESFPTVQKSTTEKGEWFSAADNNSSKHVALLGPKIATELFGDVDPINKKIKLDGQTYTIIGVLKPQGGGLGGPTFDNYVYLPLNTLFDNFNTKVISSFVFKSKDQAAIPEAKKGISRVLEKTLKSKDFTVFDQTQLLTTIQSILGILTVGLGGISAISLIVGGIGIMNIMLVSVTERTREIGLRKALGATPNIILSQFLIEAAMLSAIGGTIGILIAFLGTLVIQKFFPARVLPESILLAFGVSTAVGLIFGAAPARQASKLSPIEALRSE
jgi:putative ABC transport system permease protein